MPLLPAAAAPLSLLERLRAPAKAVSASSALSRTPESGLCPGLLPRLLEEAVCACVIQSFSAQLGRMAALDPQSSVSVYQ